MSRRSKSHCERRSPVQYFLPQILSSLWEWNPNFYYYYYYLFVCLFVSKITKKIMKGSSWNCQDRSAFIQGTYWLNLHMENEVAWRLRWLGGGLRSVSALVEYAFAYACKAFSDKQNWLPGQRVKIPQNIVQDSEEKRRSISLIKQSKTS